ncbi:hypothetical protein [Pararhodobacter zhoushanensis]|uniref:hypothetical protein n=1 Tax=Pararhodobacter zhoushanensis TaxID=2479545 RepID=UPI003CCC663C
MMGDILEKDEGQLGLGDDAGDLRPAMLRVVRAPALSRDGELLARIARSDDVHRAAPRAAVEDGNIVPDNRLIQGRVFHPRHESGCGVTIKASRRVSSKTGQWRAKRDQKRPLNVDIFGIRLFLSEPSHHGSLPKYRVLMASI